MKKVTRTEEFYIVRDVSGNEVYYLDHEPTMSEAKEIASHNLRVERVKAKMSLDIITFIEAANITILDKEVL